MPKETSKLVNEKIKQISYNIRTNDIRFGEHGHKRESRLRIKHCWCLLPSWVKMNILLKFCNLSDMKQQVAILQNLHESSITVPDNIR